MEHAACDRVTPSPEIAARIADAVYVHGLAPVARQIGVSRGGLASYLARAARSGTVVLIESRAARLAEAR